MFILAVSVLFPINAFFATAKPPAVVILPPFVVLVASVVFEIPKPPAVVMEPVVLLVLAVVVLNVADVPVITPIVVAPNVVVPAVDVKPESNVAKPLVIDIPPPPVDCNFKDPASFLIVAVFTPPSPVLVELFKNIFRELAVLLPKIIVE